MNQHKKTSRRKFIAITGMASAGLVLGASEAEASSYNRISGSNDKTRMGITGTDNKSTHGMPFAGTRSSETLISGAPKSKIYFFTKPLDNYETEFMAETLAMAGVDGFDLTVRRGGKVEPDKVAEDLPKVVETGNKFNIATHLMVTGILGTEERQTENILRTASSLGIKHYRLGYYSYDFSEGVIKSLEAIKSRMKDLSDMNRHYRIQAGYQNHDGNRYGAPLWDIWHLIKDLPVEAMSNQYDVRHGVAEGYRSWIIALHLLSKHIGSLAIKDFSWDIQNGRARAINVPLGKGLVDFPLYYKTLKELNISVPVSLHIEYPLLSKSEEGHSLIQKQKIIANQIKKEVLFIREQENLV